MATIIREQELRDIVIGAAFLWDQAAGALPKRVSGFWTN